MLQLALRQLTEILQLGLGLKGALEVAGQQAAAAHDRSVGMTAASLVSLHLKVCLQAGVRGPGGVGVGAMLHQDTGSSRSCSSNISSSSIRCIMACQHRR